MKQLFSFFWKGEEKKREREFIQKKTERHTKARVVD
jgi:hypothetical protein